MERHTNRLAGETSPYLLQHAHNPVNWYPWGPEALEKARAEQKPILLSIGYSACHWCHVMERESFENESTAAIMNRLFVSVKVDREERPDLDAIYMEAVQAMTGHGGWPMTVFLTPEGHPFWGGTYFPPEDRPGMPSFNRVLLALGDAWQERRDDVLGNAREMAQRLARGPEALQNTRTQPGGPVGSNSPPEETRPGEGAGGWGSLMLAEATQNLLGQYDEAHGGFGGAPKFPQPMAVEFLLRQWRRSKSAEIERAVRTTLERMARGGMYDQLGGGFHRYSVDAVWLAPHFEKMLYDNAQLARTYLYAYQALGDEFFRTVAEQTLDYVLRDMTDPGGGFYSTEDADSEGEEGKFYVWTLAELRAVLGEEDARLVGAYYDVTEGGNFEHGHSILHVERTGDDVARELGVSRERLDTAVERALPLLLQARAQRVHPARDEKVLAAWNGLMLRALAEAGVVLGREDYLRAAIRNGEFLLGTMRGPDGRLRRTWKPGHGDARLNGYLEDYANGADGFVALYEATFDLRWLIAAREMADAMDERFADEDAGGFYDTSVDHERLVKRPKDLYDNATPAGNSVAADVLLRLAQLTGDTEYQRRGRRVVELAQSAMLRYPLAFGRLLCVLDFLLSTPKEVVIVGNREAADTEALRRAAFQPYVPNKVVAGAAPDDEPARSMLPLLQQRPMLDGRATAYVCEHYTCQAPVTSPDELRNQLVQG